LSSTLSIASDRTSKESDRIRQAFKLFTSQSSITPDLFEKRIESLMGVPVPKELTMQLFNKYDIDKSGDIDISEFVVGLMPKDYTTVSWNVQRENEEQLELKKVSLYNNPDMFKSVWKGSLKELETRLQDTITQHTSKSSDQIRQAFSLFTAARGIKPEVFKRSIEKLIHAKISENQSMELFQKYDTDGSGDIDLQEFVSGLMPSDYRGTSLFVKREDHRREKHKQLVAQGAKKVKWDLTLDDLQKRLQDKVVQHTSRSSDQYRQAFHMFTTGSHNIKPEEFKKQIDRIMDADVPEEQCQQLFKRFDTDNSGDIDLQVCIFAELA
jgi:Ca2+-binding EF-hand superfamily protein